MSYWRQYCHFTWLGEPRKGLAFCMAKAVPLFLSYSKTLSIGPATGIKPTTSHSAVKHSNLPVQCRSDCLIPHLICSNNKFDFNKLQTGIKLSNLTLVFLSLNCIHLSAVL